MANSETFQNCTFFVIILAQCAILDYAVVRNIKHVIGGKVDKSKTFDFYYWGYNSTFSIQNSIKKTFTKLVLKKVFFHHEKKYEKILHHSAKII